MKTFSCLFLSLLLGTLLTMTLSTSCFSLLDKRANARYDAEADQLMERIHLGMDIDEVIADMRNDGFLVRGKYEWEDCHFDYCKMYNAGVYLGGEWNIPWHETFRYVVGIPIRQRPWLYITASLDGKIVRISRDP